MHHLEVPYQILGDFSIIINQENTYNLTVAFEEVFQIGTSRRYFDCMFCVCFYDW